ncbi:MAG TPA: hypothetical protein VFI33_11395 [Puia sp.]|nr:hypothetical protein [Puia sp.]
MKISESEQFDDAQLKGKTAGHSKEEGSDITKDVQVQFGKDSQIVFTGNDQMD